MSLHAQSSPEAAAQLHVQQRNTTITSIIVAVLVVLLGGLVLLSLLLPKFDNFRPAIMSYQIGTEEQTQTTKRKITRAVTRNPSAPSSVMAKVITPKNNSPIAIPVPEVNTPEPSTDYGNGDDIGDGWGIGGGGGFGSTDKLGGTISGYLYDFKQTPDGKSIQGYSTDVSSHFTDRINRLHRNHYSAHDLNRFYRTKQPLHIRYIAIPFSNASDGPRYFNAENEIMFSETLKRQKKHDWHGYP